MWFSVNQLSTQAWGRWFLALLTSSSGVSVCFLWKGFHVAALHSLPFIGNLNHWNMMSWIWLCCWICLHKCPKSHHIFQLYKALFHSPLLPTHLLSTCTFIRCQPLSRHVKTLFSLVKSLKIDLSLYKSYISLGAGGGWRQAQPAGRTRGAHGPSVGTRKATSTQIWVISWWLNGDWMVGYHFQIDQYG